MCRHRWRRCGRVSLASLVLVFLPAVSLAQARSDSPRPPTLITSEQAVQLALEHNQTLRANRLNIDQSRANEVTAGLKPNPVVTSTNADFPVFTPSQISLPNTQTYTESLSYLFERGGKREKRVVVARDTTEATVKTVDDAERQIRFQVQQAFIAVLLAKSNLDLAQQDLKDFGEVVTIDKQRMASGDISEGDYLKIALQKLQLEQDVSAAEVSLVQGKAVLRQLVGYETVADDFDVAGTLAHQKYALALADLQQQALAARPDLLAASINTRLANNTVALAFGNRAPDLTGEVEYDRNGPVNGIGFGFSIALPIHNRNQGEIARSEVAVRQARESESAARVTVLTDVANAYAGFQTNEKVVSLFESGYLDQASQSREISTYAYRRGASSLLDLLDAERTYRATELAYRQALAAYMTGAAQINFVVGRQVIQ
jgi:cobalt-zinc-cadmium efflux system outer membrane protein